MKKLSLFLLAFSLIIFSGCQSDNSGLEGLLKSVPSSAAAVVGINLHSIIEDAGCKIDNNVMKPGKEVSELISKMNQGDRKDLMLLMNGDTGVSLESAVIFYDSSRVFLTFYLYDTAKFKSFVESQSGSSFVEENGISVADNKIAVKGDQVWICMSNNRRIDPDGIASYSTLSEARSFYKTEMAKIILESDDDFTGWGDFSALISNLSDRGTTTVISLTAGLLFEDVEALSFSLDFEKGEADFELNFLNSKGKPAKYLLPSEKINVNTLKNLGGTCNELTALTVTPKTIEKISKIGSAFGGGFLGDMKEAFKNIDGTMAFALGENKDDLSGIITTTGPLSNEVKSIISGQGCEMTEDGNFLKFSKGNVAGSMSINDIAPLLKDYCMGGVGDANTLAKILNISPEISNPFSTITFGFKPEGGGIKLNIEVNAVDRKENILLTFLKSI